MPMYDLSAGEQTPEGRFLSHLWYRTQLLDDMFDRGVRGGTPHSGGQHKLYLEVERKDLDAFLELILERYSTSPLHGKNVQAFVAMARERAEQVDLKERAKRFDPISLKPRS